jgi:hypothetical protein
VKWLILNIEQSNEYKNAQKLFKREEKKVNAAFTKTVNDPDNTRLYDECEQAISERNESGESSESIFGYLDMMKMIGVDNGIRQFCQKQEEEIQQGYISFYESY